MLILNLRNFFNTKKSHLPGKLFFYMLLHFSNLRGIKTYMAVISIPKALQDKLRRRGY